MWECGSVGVWELACTAPSLLISPSPHLPVSPSPHLPIPATAYTRLTAETKRHTQATISRSLEQNSLHFNQARDKLERWADDMVLAAEKALQDTKASIKALRRQARQAVTLEEQHAIQEKIRQLEKQQRRQRQEIFQVEDEIMEKRDALIESLEKRLSQNTATETLFTIHWRVA